MDGPSDTGAVTSYLSRSGPVLAEIRWRLGGSPGRDVGGDGGGRDGARSAGPVDGLIPCRDPGSAVGERSHRWSGWWGKDAVSRGQVGVVDFVTELVESLGQPTAVTGAFGPVGVDVGSPVDRDDEVIACTGGGDVEKTHGFGVLEPAMGLVSLLEAGGLDRGDAGFHVALTDSGLQRASVASEESWPCVLPGLRARHAGEDGDRELQSLRAVDGEDPYRIVIDLGEHGLGDTTLLVSQSETPVDEAPKGASPRFGEHAGPVGQ